MERDRNWHRLTNAQLEALFRSDSATGLDESEAARRLRRTKNTIWHVEGTSVKKYAAKTLMDLTTLLLVATVVSAAAFGGGQVAAVILIMLAIGRIARIGAYVWAQRRLEKNARAALPRAKVVRGGNVKIIPADMIVPGDVIILDSGDTVPCDMRLTAADGVIVSESAVTDNRGVVSKNSEPLDGDDIPVMLRTNMVYATSAVVSGFAIGIAVATGRDTLVAAREGVVELSDAAEVPVLESLSDWSRICSLCLTGAAFVLTVIGVLVGGSSLFQVFLPSIAMAAACLSEYLSAVGAFTWALTLKSDGKEVMRSAAAAETAANADVMVIRSPKVMRSGKITLHSYYRNSKLSMMGAKGVQPPQRLLALACYCTGCTPGGSLASGSFGLKTRHTGVLDYTLVRSLWETHGKKDKDPGYTIVQHIAAGDEMSDGLDSVLVAKGNSFYFAAMGKVSNILSRSSSVRVGNEVVPLDDAERARIEDYAKNLKKRGVTLCAVGFRRSHYNSLRRISVLQTSLCFEGFFAVSDRMEDEAAGMVDSFRRGGGSVVIFSDAANVEEDKYFLEAEGVFKTGDTYITKGESPSLKSRSDESGSLALICVPDGAEGIRERLRILKLYTENESKCAYIGCGVEDMWCMQSADVSFAVPDRASGGVPQILRTSADGIVSGDGGGGFCGVFRLMERCRHALVNIRHMLKYLIVSHVARLVLILIGAASSMPMPSAPQLIFWGLIMDLAASAAIAAVPYCAGREGFSSGANAHAVPNDAGEVLIPTLYGALCALFATAVPFVSRAVFRAAGMEINITDGGYMSSIFISCIFAMPFAASEIAGGYGIFSKRSVWGKTFILPYAAAAVGIAAELLMPVFGIDLGSQFPGWFITAFSVLPAALLISVMSVVRALMNKKQSNNKKSND